jgi:N-methylhydantoinase A
MSMYRVAIDTGGTNTDAFIFNEVTGTSFVAKVPSTPKNPAVAITDAIRAAGLDAADIKLITHGTTVATNALIERNFPRTAMVTTRGFRDVVEICDGTKEELWDAYVDKPTPYIRRRDRFEVNERVDYNGKVVCPLDREEAHKIARRIKTIGYQAVCVSFINSYVNLDHELEMKEILAEVLPPEVYLCTSSEIIPEMFEHPRFSTAMINAVLGPCVINYIQDLEVRLKEMGYRGDLLILHSGGGVLTAKGTSKFPARLASSGIVAGAIAGAHIAKQAGFSNAISFDMGGTSTDVALTYNGELKTANSWQVEYGYPIMFPSVEVLTIGAGGGSIAWIDAGGSLCNGPQSAGADPGPACYGLGGEEATNTDANLVLGRLDSALLGGRLSLDREASALVLAQKVAKPLGLELATAGNAMLKVAEANMANAVRLISVGRGYDPRDFALVAFGGAGPLHGAYLARELEIPTVIFPRYPGIASAMGCLLVDIRHDSSKMHLGRIEDVNLPQLVHHFEVLEEEARNHLREEGVPEEQMRFSHSLDMRYVGQWRTLTVPIDLSDIERALPHALAKFHQEHQRAYSYSDHEREIEIFSLKLVTQGLIPKPDMPKLLQIGTAQSALVGHRKVYFEEAGGYVETAVFDRGKLLPGAKVEGPAIVEQLDSTVVLPPGTKSEIDPYLNIITTFA